MSHGRNHYYQWDLRRDLQKLGLEQQVAELEEADRAVSAAIHKRNDVANALLEKHLKEITPLLRPCHKSMGKALSVECM